MSGEVYKKPISLKAPGVDAAGVVPQISITDTKVTPTATTTTKISIEDPVYRKKVYQLLKNDFSDFALSETDFYKKLDTDQTYAPKVYKLIKENYEDFTKPEQDFLFLMTPSKKKEEPPVQQPVQPPVSGQQPPVQPPVSVQPPVQQPPVSGTTSPSTSPLPSKSEPGPKTPYKTNFQKVIAGASTGVTPPTMGPLEANQETVLDDGYVLDLNDPVKSLGSRIDRNNVRSKYNERKRIISGGNVMYAQDPSVYDRARAAKFEEMAMTQEQRDEEDKELKVNIPARQKDYDDIIFEFNNNPTTAVAWLSKRTGRTPEELMALSKSELNNLGRQTGMMPNGSFDATKVNMTDLEAAKGVVKAKIAKGLLDPTKWTNANWTADSPDFRPEIVERAAISWAVENDPDSRQTKFIKSFSSPITIKKPDGTSETKNYYGNPREIFADTPAVLGALVFNYLSDPVNQATWKDNPSFQKAVADYSKNYPKFATRIVANKVSQAYEKSGKRGFLSRIAQFNTSGLARELDETAKQILSPQEYEVYVKNIKGKEDEWLEVPSVVEEFGKGISSVFTGLASTFTEPSKSTRQTQLEAWEKEASSVSADQKMSGWKLTNDIFHMLGFVSGMAAGGEVLKGVEGFAAGAANLPRLLSPTALNATNAGLVFFGENLKNGKLKYPDEPLKAATSAGVNTILFMALAKDLFPTKNINNAIRGAQPEIDAVVNQLTTGAITKEVARAEMTNIYTKIGQTISNSLGQNIKASGEMAGISAIDRGLDTIMGLDKDKMDVYHGKNAELETFKNMFLGNLGVAAWAGYGKMRYKNSAAISSYYDVAKRPNFYRKVVNNGEGTPAAKAEILENINFVEALKKELDAMGMSESKQAVFIANAIGQKALLAKKSVDPTLQAENEKAVSEIKADQDKLINNPQEEITITEEGDFAPAKEKPEVVAPTAEQQFDDVQKGNVVTFTYDNESQVPEVFKDKISSKGELNGKPFVRVTVAKSLADYELGKVGQKPVTESKLGIPIAETKPKVATEEVPTEVPDLPKPVKVSDVVDRDGTYKGQKGRFYLDGKTLVFDVDNSNREYEVGNIDEIGATSIKDFGIKMMAEGATIDRNEAGNLVVRGQELVNMFSDPAKAINKNEAGEVVSVNLETPDGKKRTFRGNTAKNIAAEIEKDVEAKKVTPTEVPVEGQGAPPVQPGVAPTPAGEVKPAGEPAGEVKPEVPAAEETIRDRQIPVKREYFKYTDGDGNVTEFRSVTRLDGSRQWDEKREGETDFSPTKGFADQSVIKKENLSALDEIKILEDKENGYTVEKLPREEGYDAVANRKMWDKLSDRQKQLANPERFEREKGEARPPQPTTIEQQAAAQQAETERLIGGEAEKNRKAGKYVKDGVEYVRNESGQGTYSDQKGEVRFTNEVSVPFRYKLVEAETLQPSHSGGLRNPNHFIPEAQPKSRLDKGSIMAEEGFANNPRFDELGENTNAYSGAPVVNQRNEVVQGNNRAAGLKKGYERNNPAYKEALRANATKFGFSPSQVDGMKNPVLVREVAVADQGAIELGNYDVKDLETGGKRRLDPIAVTRRMSFESKQRLAELLFGFEGTLNQAIRGNVDRVMEIMKPLLNQAQRNTILNKEGNLTEAGAKDLELVVQQLMFDNGDPALPDLFENLSSIQKEGLRKALPHIFAAGAEKNLVKEVQNAIVALNDFEASGAKDFNQWLSQTDAFKGGKTPKQLYTPLELSIVELLRNATSQKQIKEKFQQFENEVKDKEADMFEAAKKGKDKDQAAKEIFDVKEEEPVSEKPVEEKPKEVVPQPKDRSKYTIDDYKNEINELEKQGKTEESKNLTEELGKKLREGAFDKEPAQKVEAKAGETISNLIDKYEEGEIGTFDDFVNEVEALEDPKFQDAIDGYRKEQQEDFKLGGRGDMEAAQEKFMQQVREQIKTEIYEPKEKTTSAGGGAEVSGKPTKGKTGAPSKVPTKGKFESDAEKIAENIMNFELPSWLKGAKLPPGTEKMGPSLPSEQAIKKALANAVIKMGKLLDRGVEFSQAVKEATRDLVKLFGKNQEQDIQKNFSNYYNDAISKQTAGKVPVQPEAGVGEKVEGGVPGAEPKKPAPEKEGGQAEGKKEEISVNRKKAFLNKIIDAKGTPEAAKEGLRSKGLDYKTKSQKEAAELAESVLDAEGVDAAVDLAERETMDGDVNALIMMKALERLSDMEAEASSPADKQKYAIRFAEIADIQDRMAREKGRFNAAISYFYRKSPLGIVINENNTRKRRFDEWAEEKEKSWKDYFKSVDELVQDPEVAEIIKQKVLEGLGSRIKEKGATGRAIKNFANKIRQGKISKLGGFKSSTGYDAVWDGSLEVVARVLDATGDLANAIEAGLDYVRNTDWYKNLANKDDFESKYAEHFYNEYGVENKSLAKAERYLNQLRKKLPGLNKKQQEEVIKKSFIRIVESGGLDYQDFRDIIGEVTGRGPLSEAEAQKMKDLVEKTNGIEDAAKRVQEERTPEAIKDYKIAELEAAKAASELQEMIDTNPNIWERVTSIMQLNTLGIPSLINNPIYNFWNQAFVRAPIGLVNTTIDVAMSNAYKVIGKEYSPSEYNVLSAQVQKEFFKKLGLGYKESLTQFVTGLNRQDYLQKELTTQKIRPLESLKALARAFTGKQKLTNTQKIDKALQATVGLPAEIVARTLNLGDKPQRFAAEGATAAQFAKTLGLKDIDYSIFMEFPREEAYRVLRQQGKSETEAAQQADYIKEAIIKEGKRSTFQQDNLLNTVLNAAFNAKMPGGIETPSALKGAGNLIKSLTISPYIKIPANAYWSYYNLVNPEVALLQSMVYAGIGRSKAERKPVESKLAMREARYWFGHAVVGVATRAVILALVQQGVFNAGSSKDETAKEREGEATYTRPGTINIDKLQAVLSGKNPDDVKGGVLVPIKYLGQFGTIGNTIAKQYEEMTPEQRKAKLRFWDAAIGGMEASAVQELQEGIFSNTSAMLSALQDDNSLSRYGLNVVNLLTNIVHPAAISQIERAALPYVSTSKADTFMGELKNSFLQRSAVLRALTGEYPPAKVNIWGDKMDKKENWALRLFGVSKENEDAFAMPIWNLVKKTEDIGFLPPSVDKELKDGVELTPTQKMELQTLIGQARKSRVAPIVNNLAYLKGFGDMKFNDLDKFAKEKGLNEEETNDLKKLILSNLYTLGREDALYKFYQKYPEMNKNILKESKDYEISERLRGFREVNRYDKTYRDDKQIQEMATERLYKD